MRAVRDLMSRLDDSLAGDLLGVLCLAVILYGALFIGAVLS